MNFVRILPFLKFLTACGIIFAAPNTFATRNNVAFWRSGLPPYTWVGKGGNANWNTAANWSGGVVPGSGNTAVFESDVKTLCASNCSPTINVNISVGGVSIRSGYGGTITQGSGNTVTIGAAGWSQAAGTFTGGNSSITMTGPTSISGGTFTSTSATLTIRHDYAVTGAGTFNANSGTFLIDLPWGIGAREYYPGTGNYNTVIITGNEGVYNFHDTMTVLGTLTLGDGSTYGRYLNSGTISAKGDVVFTANGMHGTGLLKISGNTNQTITGTSSTSMLSLEIASTGGTVTYSGTFVLENNYTVTSGTVDASNSTLKFRPQWSEFGVITPGTVAYNNVIISGWDSAMSLVGTMTVNGTTTFSETGGGTLNGGTVVANGDVVFANNGAKGSTSLTFGGSTATTLTIAGTAYRMSGTITVNKTGSGSVTLSANSTFNSVGQDLTIASGTLDLGGNVLTVNDVLNVTVDGTLRCSGGSYTSGSMIMDGSIDCAGYAYNWSGAGGNTNWNNGANWVGGSAPNSTKVAVFKDTYCGSTCNATIDTNIDIRGIKMYAPYTGTVTQGSGNTIYVRAIGWDQAAGNFVGGNAAVTFDLGGLKLSGGTYTATTSTTLIFNTSGTISGATFNSNNGLFKIYSYGYNVTLAMGSANFNNFEINGLTGNYSIVGTINVLGNLTINPDDDTSINTGTIAVSGNVTSVGGASKKLSGTAHIKLIGNASGQTVTGSSCGFVPGLEIDAGTNNVTLAGYLCMKGSYKVTSVGTLTTTGSKLEFQADCSGYLDITPGTATYNAVSFYSVCGTTRVTGTLKAAGDVTIVAYYNGTINNGTVEVGGNLSSDGTNGPTDGSTNFKLTGNASGQTISGANEGWIPSLEIDAGANAVTMTGNLTVTGNYVVTSVGTFSATGSRLKLQSPAYGTVSVVPGTVTYNDVTLDGIVGLYNVAGTMRIDGNLILAGSYNSTVNGGTLSVKGNVSSAADFFGGDSVLELRGTSPTIDFANGHYLSGNVNINLASGTAVLASNVDWSATGQTLNFTSGDLNMAGKNLSVKALTLNGRTLTRNGGTLTVNGIVVTSGSLYGGTVAP